MISNEQIARGHLDAGHPAPNACFMANRKKTSGIVTEEQRHTKRVVLRLSPEVESELRWFAGERDWSLSETVTRALAALQREEDGRSLGACEDIIRRRDQNGETEDGE
jgi:hypothetical protein